MFRAVRLFDGVRFHAGPQDVLIQDGRIASVTPAEAGATAASRTVDGGVLLPGFVDAHVHLTLSDPLAVARRGVTTVVDLGAPSSVAFRPAPPLRCHAAGPLITARRGYPTRSWGRAGYGLEVDDERSARDAVAFLVDAGASIIKVAVEPGEPPVLAPSLLHTVVDEAHRRNVRVAAHALRRAAVRDAIDAGADILAHSPVEPLDQTLVSTIATRGTIVISTVRAFGASAAAIDNLTALANAGAPVAYGTDLGNGAIEPGIDAREIALLASILGSLDAALAAATSGSGEVAGTGGRIRVNEPADLVWMRALEGAQDLGGDVAVWIGGVPVA